MISSKQYSYFFFVTLTATYDALFYRTKIIEELK